MDTSQLALKQLNELNQQFWIEQSELCERRMSDEAVRKRAFTVLDREALRRVSAKSQLSLESALEDAEQEQFRILREFSRKGGQAPKKEDALNMLIQGLVWEHPDITQTQLLQHLKREIGQGTIDRITSDSELCAGDVRTIYFAEKDGRKKTAPVAGLKDRLARAKKKIKQEIDSR
jgi:hypothetical protein